MEPKDSAQFPNEVVFNFRTAKIEHYLERAQEYLTMARVVSAREMIDRVLGLDQGNETARSIVTRINLLEALVSKNGEGRSNGNESPLEPLVLIVDQDERILTALSSALTARGYRVASAGGFKEALKILEAAEPSVIVSEVNFENGPLGFDLYLHTSSHTKTAQIPFLFLATRIDRDILIAGKKLGVDDFILKPLDEEVVVVSISNSLARKRRLTIHP
jgi:PleD family two-component response regulator